VDWVSAAEEDVALLQPSQVLRVEVREWLRLWCLANTSRDEEGGGGAISVAGVVIGNVISIAEIVDAVESSGRSSRTRFDSILM